ncbi:uncharacterized protein LOC119179807 isoform X3 [Rhipicephalus microplus]|uniref:uncharacterized protein LOC119179807 isoform X3 n=1 Tax=Rhipicephalus microplus TaxID=6941 RepID=UPI003F6C8F9D
MKLIKISREVEVTVGNWNTNGKTKVYLTPAKRGLPCGKRRQSTSPPTNKNGRFSHSGLRSCVSCVGLENNMETHLKYDIQRTRTHKVPLGNFPSFL